MANDNSTPYQADADVIQAARGIRRSPPQLAALMSPGPASPLHDVWRRQRSGGGRRGFDAAIETRLIEPLAGGSQGKQAQAEAGASSRRRQELDCERLSATLARRRGAAARRSRRLRICAPPRSMPFST